MTFIPNVVVSLLAGVATDGYGDETDNATVATSGLPASLVSQRETVTTYGERGARHVRWYVCRLPAGTVLPTALTGVRVDSGPAGVRGATFIVDADDTAPGLGVDLPVTLALRRT